MANFRRAWAFEYRKYKCTSFVEDGTSFIGGWLLVRSEVVLFEVDPSPIDVAEEITDRVEYRCIFEEIFK